MGIRDDSSAECSLLKLSCWAMKYFAPSKKKTNQKPNKREKRKRGGKCIEAQRLAETSNPKQCITKDDASIETGKHDKFKRIIDTAN